MSLLELALELPAAAIEFVTEGATFGADEQDDGEDRAESGPE